MKNYQIMPKDMGSVFKNVLYLVSTLFLSRDDI